MSENIESSLNKLSKKHGGTYTYNPKYSATVFERKDSGVTKCSQFAVIREKILLPNDNNHIVVF